MGPSVQAPRFRTKRTTMQDQNHLRLNRSLALPGALVLLLILSIFTRGAWAAQSEPFESAPVNARLIVAEEGVAPGAANLSAGLALDLGEGWKTYWRSPGEVGIPPEIDWSESDNLADVEFLWPAPERFTAFGIENFGYHERVVFPLRLKLERPGEPVHLAAMVRLLTCSDVCVPQDFNLSLSLGTGSGIDTEAAAEITAFAERVPLDAGAAGIVASRVHVDAERTVLTVGLESSTAFTAPDVFAEFGTATSFGRPDIRLADGGRDLWARIPILGFDETGADRVAITVTDPERRAVTISPSSVPSAPEPPFSVAQTAPGFAKLASIAMVALLGGLILNAMPCVLPVLSIKLSAAINLQGRDRTAVRRGFLAAAAGVLSFTWILASVLYLLRSAGLSVGWGLQFQSPVFLAIMVVVLTIFTANLSGLFEISLPAGLMQRLAGSGPRTGLAADFATGMFSAVMATPCSAPFLGTAVAFALAGRGIDIFIVFTGLGAGLALPYLAVAAWPNLITHLPKPGRWMAALKVVLGGLLALTTLWLIWVLNGVAGRQIALVVGGLAALLIVVLAWRRAPVSLRRVAVVLLALAPVAAAAALPPATPAVIATVTGPDWLPFERSEIARRVSRGEVVFVEVTADWCLTCKANRTLVIDREPVAAALRAPEITTMLADWTRSDPGITRFLESNGRYGIPFNAVYGPAAPGGIVLPEVLTATAVLDALTAAQSAPGAPEL